MKTEEQPPCVEVEEVAAHHGPEPTHASTGFTGETEVSEIEHPPCAVTDPCIVTITFDSSFGAITDLFYNGVPVRTRASAASASPDPCILCADAAPS